MDEILSATVDSRNGIVLDPRTKLFMLITNYNIDVQYQQ